LKAKHRVSQKLVAVKRITKNQDDKNILTDAIHEDTLLSCLRHKRIIKLIDSFDSTGKYNMVLQKMDMDLVKYLNTYDIRKDPPAKRKIFKMIAEGVTYIHSMNIVHFDLKPDNILVNVDSQGNITDLRISDFGFSRSFNVFNTNSDF